MVAVRVLVWAVFGAGVGFALGQYYPVLSGPLVKNLCEPFSRCRNDAVIGYIVGGVVVGAVLGLINHVLVRQRKS